MNTLDLIVRLQALEQAVRQKADDLCIPHGPIYTRPDYGGGGLAADWDTDGDVYEDGGIKYLDVTKGHLHVHGRGLYDLSTTSQVTISGDTGYVYLEFDTTTELLSVEYENAFPESTSQVWNFLLYKIEGYLLVRDLRTAFNFGSPI